MADSPYADLVYGGFDPLRRASAVSQLGGGGGGGLDLSSAFSMGSDAAAPAPAPPPQRGGGLDDLSPMLTELVKRQMEAARGGGNNDDLTSQDKGLALAQAGFAIAGGKSPHALTNIGAGAAAGIGALQKMRMERAQMRMKELQGVTSALGTASLIPQRESRAALNNQQVGFNASAIIGQDQLRPLVDLAIQTGNPEAVMSRLGVGSAGNVNRRNFIALLPQGSDLAQRALTWASDKSQAEQTGRNIAGPQVINEGAGQTRPTPPPLPVVAPPQGAAPASLAAPASASSPAPASAPPPHDPLMALIPTAIPFSQPKNTAENAQFKEEGLRLGKLSGAIDDAAASAQKGNFMYNNMNAAHDKFVTGKGSEVWNEANAYLLQFGDMFGLDTKSLGEKVGNFQDFQKNAVNLTGAATKAVSPRASTQEMLFLGKGVPQANMADKGYSLIVNQLQAVNDFALAQQTAKNLWLKKNNNNLNGFEAWFTDNVDPAVFMLNRMSPEDRSAAIQSMTSRPGGSEAAKRLSSQWGMAKQFGWVQ